MAYINIYILPHGSLCLLERLSFLKFNKANFSFSFVSKAFSFVFKVRQEWIVRYLSIMG